MRLICPNCGAQYEVGNDVIPEQGRDVQCSNCGHTWFESPGASEAAEAKAMAGESSDVEDPSVDDAPDDIENPSKDSSNAPEPEEEADTDIVPPAPPEDLPPRPALESSIADILREEAAREEASRQAEAQGGIESQEEMGVEDLPPILQKDVTSDPTIPNENAAAVAATVSNSRRELLPDIDDINATLRSSSEREPPPLLPEEEVIVERRGFRLGFFGMLAILALLVAVYIFADTIGDTLPFLNGILDAFTNVIDGLRLWLDGQIQVLLNMLDGPQA